MRILTLLRMVPDVVEELEIAADGNCLDLDAARMILSESDDHALEQALLLKERHGGTVTVIAPDAPEVDDALYTALAKGADRALKITGLDPGLGTAALARSIAQTLVSEPGLLPADLILTGVQAYDDLDGLVAPLLAHDLGLPQISIVTRVDIEGNMATVFKEFSGGVRGELEVELPAVLGIQAAEQPPRYVPVAKVRAAMKTSHIDTRLMPVAADGGRAVIEVAGMTKPEAAGHAEMLEGAPEEIAATLCGLLAARGLL